MLQNATEATPPPAVRAAAAILITRHGAAALGLAALSASRSMRVRAPEEAAFWLSVCDVIRVVRHTEAEGDRPMAALH